MNWRPIKEYDSLKKKPRNCMFLFKRGEGKQKTLEPIITDTRTYGFRTCTHFIVLPPFPEDSQ